MASNEPEVANNNSETLAASLIEATKTAKKVVTFVNRIRDTVFEIEDKCRKTHEELTREAASVAKAEVRDFQDHLQDARVHGEDVRKRCLELDKKWSRFEGTINSILKKHPIGKEDVQHCISQLQLMLECAAECGMSYEEFKEKLRHAVDAGDLFAKQCGVGAEEANSKASYMRWMGYGAAALGLVVAGFLAFATKNGNILSAAAGAAGAAGATGVYTHTGTSKLEKMAAELDGLMTKLNNCLKDLNQLGEKLNGLFRVTEQMAKHIEFALKFFTEKESSRLKDEETAALNERLKQENEETAALNERLKQENEETAASNERLKQEKEETAALNERLKQEKEDMKKQLEEQAQRFQQLEIEEKNGKNKN